MIANLENIQIVYNEIPNSWIVDGVQTDNYKKSEEHYLHGWRDVVIPTITTYQRLSDDYVLVGEIVTKEVIDFTAEEITAHNISKAMQIDLEYKSKITDVLRIPIEKVMCGEYESIPQSKLDERDFLRNECNAKILELGITDFTYRQSVPKLAKIL